MRTLSVRRKGFVGSLVALMIAIPGLVFAQAEYPSRPIRMVTVAPGGATDILARLIAGDLTKTLGQQVVVDPRPGGSGVVASEIVTRATPDGYTLLVTYHAHTINPARGVKLPYDPIKGFTPITQLITSGSMLTVNASSPPKSLKEFITWTKDYTGNLNAGVPGVGSGGYLAAVMYDEMTGVKAEPINHAGSSAALRGLLGREYQYAFTSVMSAMSFVRSGQLRAIAVTTPKRLNSLPDIPALAEAVPGFDVAGWWGVLGPPGIPRNLVMRINGAIIKALKNPRIHKIIEADGGEIVGSSPEEFRKFLITDLEKWPKILKQAKIK